jgi:hypothetical protein
MNAQLSTRDKSRRGARPAERWRIEGEYFTFAEIAKRLGVGRDAVRLRMQKLRGASGAVTWERLAAFGKRSA